MIHSDNEGLVLPPKAAQYQCVVVPIVSKDNKEAVTDRAYEVKQILQESGIRCIVDCADNHNPGFKYSHWELRGTPVCIRIGNEELKEDKIAYSIRHLGVEGRKQIKSMPMSTLANDMHACLEQIHQDMLAKATAARDKNIKTVKDWESFMKEVNAKQICLAPWCDTVKCEETAKERSKAESEAAMEAANEGEVLLTGAAKTLCIPFELGK